MVARNPRLGHSRGCRPTKIVTAKIHAKHARDRRTGLLCSVFQRCIATADEYELAVPVGRRRLLRANDLDGLRHERHPMRSAVLCVGSRNHPPAGQKVDIRPAHLDDFPSTLGREEPHLLNGGERQADRTHRILRPPDDRAARCGPLACCRWARKQMPEPPDFVVGEHTLALVLDARLLNP